MQVISAELYSKLCNRTWLQYLCFSTNWYASRSAKDLADCRCNTVHTNYHIPVGTNKTSYNTINGSLSDGHVLIIDEVFMFSFYICNFNAVSISIIFNIFSPFNIFFVMLIIMKTFEFGYKRFFLLNICCNLLLFVHLKYFKIALNFSLLY